MQGTFVDWFFYGLAGIGGWIIFLLIALAAVFWVIYDSQKRQLPAIGWIIGVVLVSALLFPTLLYRFLATAPTSFLIPYRNIIFYIGVVGGIAPLVVAAAYYFMFQGMAVCDYGHLYEAELGVCTECASAPQTAEPHEPEYIPASPQPPLASPPVRSRPAKQMPPPKPKVQAWLAGANGENYQLNLGETTIGRASVNDIQISDDTTLSKQHAKIMEEKGHFRLYDLGSTNGTFVNKRRVRQPVLLQPDDEIQFGDNTKMRFVTALRRTS